MSDQTDKYFRFRSFLNKSPKTWRGVFIRFAEYTSFQGIPFIYRSRYILAKFIWIFFFLVALTCTIGHYYLVAHKYLTRGVTTKVTVGYSDLPFPSVSICNINPIRQSAVGNDIQPLRSFLDAIEPPSTSRANRYEPSQCHSTTRRMNINDRQPHPNMPMQRPNFPGRPPNFPDGPINSHERPPFMPQGAPKFSRE